MTPAQFERVESVFEQAMDLPAGERLAFVRAATHDDTDVLAKVEGMLLRDREGYLEAPALGAGFHVGDPESIERSLLEELVRASHFRVTSKIGEGGFGTVYRAEQLEPVRRVVALKVIKLGMDTRQVVARFEAERQVLAVMDHPAIAKVYQAGATPSGRPFFAMELVDGVPITRYCDERRLGIHARLELFVLVCRAVQHAHQKGIIHRDLKPSNILVAEHDGRPLPKVIDFGIARAVQSADASPLGSATLVQGHPVGTPVYMSPEQAAGDRDIDTRTDVFSLGVLLYELLTGATTIPRDQLERRSPFDVVKLVRDTEPLCPSRRLTAAEQSEDIERAAHDRAATPAGLARRLRGDLDCIVMTALERDRARRYATVDALALDVVHHLENRPISAHAPTTAYRLVKFARRNRAALLIVSLVFIALAGTSVGLVRSLAAEARARTDARIAHEINAFLNDDLLATAAPEELGVDVRVRDVLLAASQRIEGRFADEPEVEAAIRLTLGRTFTRLAEFDLARHHLTRAYELRAAHFGDADARTLEATHELAQWHTLTEHYPRAEELFAKAYKGRIACLGPDHYDTIASQQALAVSIAEQGRNAEAGPLFLDALARSRAANGPDHRQSLELLRAVGLVYESSHDIEKVIQAYDECYTRSRRAFGIGNTITLLAMCDLAGTLIERGAHGDRERARDLLVECLGASTKLRGPWHPATLTVMFNLAKIHSMMGDFGAAESTLGQARDAAVASLPPGHPLTTRFDLGLAEVYDAQGRHDEACTLLTRAVEQLRSTLGDDNPSTRAGVLMLAGHYTKLGKHDQAAKVKAQLPAALQSPGGAH